MAVMSATGSMLCAPVVLRRLGSRRAVIGSGVLGGVLMVVIVLPRAPGWLWVTAGPAALVMTITLVACAALLSGAVDGESQGRVMGNNQALQVGAEALGAAAGGALAGILVPLPLVVFGVLLALTAASLLVGRRRAVAAA